MSLRRRASQLAIAGLLSLTSFPAPALSHFPGPPKKGEAARKVVRIPAPDVTLVDQQGKTFHLRDLRGKVVLVTFIYTTCPDACPLLTAKLTSIQRNLKENNQSDVYLLSITTDPEVDEPKVLASYAKRYGIDPSNWSLLTGKEQSLREVWKNFGVKVHRKARGLIDHTSLTAVVDSAGTMRVAYLGTAPDPKLVLKDIRAVLIGRKASG